MQSPDLADLPHQGADRAGRGRHQQGFPLLRLTHVQQSEIGCPAGQAEQPQVRRQRQFARRKDGDSLAAGNSVFLPPQKALHQIPHRKPGMPGLLNNSDPQTAHDLADLHRGEITLAIIQPAANRRIQRQVDIADQYLLIIRFLERLGQKFEIRRLDHAVGTGCKPPYMVYGCGHALSPLSVVRVRIAHRIKCSGSRVKC